MIRLIDGAARVHVMDKLDLDALPKGKVSRLLIELTHNAMALPVWAPVMVAKGRRHGPIFGLTAAIHGNELNGIPVIQHLFEWLESQPLRGTVVAVVVANPSAYLRHQREFEDGTDLNHMMPGEAHGNAPKVFAYRLIERIVRHFDYLIDLHTASFGRINSLYIRADMRHPIAAQMAYLQRPQIIVHNPASDHTLRGTAMAMGIPAITVEIGNPQRFQPEFIRRTLRGIRAVLAEVDMLAKRPMALGEEPVLCASSGWMYTDAGGLLEVFPGVTEYVTAGQKIARLTNVFGDVIRLYESPHDGVVIGKSVNPVAQTGARIFHIGKLAPDDHDFFRRKPWKGHKKKDKPAT